MTHRSIAAAVALGLIATPALAIDKAGGPQQATFLGFRFIANATPMEPAEQERLGKIEETFIS